MGFLGYMILGAVSYGAGWFIRTVVLQKNRAKTATPYRLNHPQIKKILAIFFSVMLVVSALIGQFLLKQDHVDIAYIIINSVVATFVFSFGLLPDKKQHEVPD